MNGTFVSSVVHTRASGERQGNDLALSLEPLLARVHEKDKPFGRDMISLIENATVTVDVTLVHWTMPTPADFDEHMADSYYGQGSPLKNRQHLIWNAE